MGNVDCSIDGGIATVTFTNPPKGFLTSATVVQLGAIMTALEADDAVRVIVFTGGLPTPNSSASTSRGLVRAMRPHMMRLVLRRARRAGEAPSPYSPKTSARIRSS